MFLCYHNFRVGVFFWFAVYKQYTSISEKRNTIQDLSKYLANDVTQYSTHRRLADRYISRNAMDPYWRTPQHCSNYTVAQKKKRHPFYMCYNLVRCHRSSNSWQKNTRGNMKQNTCTPHHTSFRLFVLHRVKSSNDFYGMQ